MHVYPLKIVGHVASVHFVRKYLFRLLLLLLLLLLVVVVVNNNNNNDNNNNNFQIYVIRVVYRQDDVIHKFVTKIIAFHFYLPGTYNRCSSAWNPWCRQMGKHSVFVPRCGTEYYITVRFSHYRFVWIESLVSPNGNID